MNQSRLDSVTESCINILVGFGVAYLANMAVLTSFGYHISHTENFHITCVMTVISFIRSYLLRRLFNKLRLFGYAKAES